MATTNIRIRKTRKWCGSKSERLTLFHDPKKGLCVRMVDFDGKVRQYGLQKDLSIDMSILPASVLAPSS